MRAWAGAFVLACLVGAVATGASSAGAIFEDGFESFHERWTKNIRGNGSIEIVDGGYEGKCLKVTAEGALAYLTTTLDPEQYAGTTVEVRAMVKLDDVKVGPQTYSTAKFHIGESFPPPRQVKNHADRWLGTFDWTEKRLVANLDEETSRIVLDLGIQNATGTAYYDNLVVSDMFGRGRPISLLPVCNLGRSDGVAGDGKGSFLDLGMNDLFALPQGNLETDDVTFYVPNHGVNAGRTCVILQGTERADLAAATEPVPIGRNVEELHFLQAAAWANTEEEEMCLLYVLEYENGQREAVWMKAGVDIGNFDEPRDFDNWKIVWRGENGAGKTVGVGAARWENPRPELALKSLTIESAGKGVPIVLAITHLRPQKP